MIELLKWQSLTCVCVCVCICACVCDGSDPKAATHKEKGEIITVSAAQHQNPSGYLFAFHPIELFTHYSFSQPVSLPKKSFGVPVCF